MEDSESRDDLYLVNRFKDMVTSNSSYYFDSDEMEIIIDHFFNEVEMDLLDKSIEYAILLFPYIPSFRLAKVKNYMLQFEFDSAKKEFENIESQFPPFPDLFIEKAYMMEFIGKDNEVLDLVNRAYELENDNPETLFFLTYEHLKRENIIEALFYAQKLLQIDDSYDERFFAFSLLFEENKKYDMALEFFNTITCKFPLLKGGWFGLGLVQSWLNNDSEAIKNYEFALSIDENMPAAHYNMGNSYYELNQIDKALDEYYEALFLDPDDFNIITAIADCYFTQNKLETSLHYYHEAIDLCPGNQDAITGIIAILEKTGKQSEILAFLKKSFQTVPQSFKLLSAVVESIENESKKEEILLELFCDTFNQIEDKKSMIEDLIYFCCQNEYYKAGLEIIIKYANVEEIAHTVNYYLALFYYLTGDFCNGEKYLSDALLINYLYYFDFLSFDEKLSEIPKIIELTNIYYSNN